MVTTASLPPDLGQPAPDFTLPDPSGRRWSLDDLRGARGTLVMFICNHCPYVLGAIDRITRDARDLQAAGVGVVAISANDVGAYPQDGPDHMARLARDHGFTFPYLYDETQSVARAYGAVCTPDFFGYNAAGRLCYRGRLDAGGRQPPAPGAPRELYQAMRDIALTGQPPARQMPGMGCSIKWKRP
ncbi:thioredoxin family protein [Paracoccus pacificus]|uniref:Thioredoxin family protein n=1 Tax=Paracoccus pacificus TaxID=1463598 RepID=A0ABW4R449_9RHOB